MDKKNGKEIISSRIKSIDLLYQYVSENKFSINTFICLCRWVLWSSNYR